MKSKSSKQTAAGRLELARMTGAEAARLVADQDASEYAVYQEARRAAQWAFLGRPSLRERLGA